MICPKCRSMLHVEKYEGVEIDVCSKCHGKWLDAGELVEIVRIEEERFSKELIHETLIGTFSGTPEDQINNLVCPSCGGNMRSLNYDYASGVVIDTCTSCMGVWLDKGEIEKVQIYREDRAKRVEKNKDKLIAMAKNTRNSEAAKLESQRTRGKFFLYSILDKVTGD